MKKKKSTSTLVLRGSWGSCSLAFHSSLGGSPGSALPAASIGPEPTGLGPHAPIPDAVLSHQVVVGAALHPGPPAPPLLGSSGLSHRALGVVVVVACWPHSGSGFGAVVCVILLDLAGVLT